jgi:uncharacterized membrane protein YfcA
MLIFVSRKERALIGLVAVALWAVGMFLGLSKVIDPYLLESVVGIIVLCLVGYVVWRIRSSKKQTLIKSQLEEERSFRPPAASNSSLREH